MEKSQLACKFCMQQTISAWMPFSCNWASKSSCYTDRHTCHQLLRLQFRASKKGWGKEITAEGFNSMNSVVKGFHLLSHSSRASLLTADAEASITESSKFTIGKRFRQSEQSNQVGAQVIVSQPTNSYVVTSLGISPLFCISSAVAVHVADLQHFTTGKSKPVSSFCCLVLR